MARHIPPASTGAMEVNMKRRLLIVSGVLLAPLAQAQLPNPADLTKGLGKLPQVPGTKTTSGAGDDKTDAAGIK
jgi:hypothetical protein